MGAVLGRPGRRCRQAPPLAPCSVAHSVLFGEGARSEAFRLLFFCPVRSLICASQRVWETASGKDMPAAEAEAHYSQELRTASLLVKATGLPLGKATCLTLGKATCLTLAQATFTACDRHEDSFSIN